MRCFLGLDLDASSKLAIDSWRARTLPAFAHPVPPANFHITSVFLGQLDTHQLDAVCSDIDVDDIPAFNLNLDHFGYWSKPKILWLGPSAQCEAANQLSQRLSRVAKRNGITIQERKYQPHLTLVRKITEPVPAPLLAPDFQCRFSTLHLFESVSTRNGVQYPIRQSWQLNPLSRR